MSDFLAEMEARRERASRPSAPVGWVVGGLIAAFVAALVVGAACIDSAAKLLAEQTSAGEHYLRLGGLSLGVIIVFGGLLYVVALRPRRPRWTAPVLGGLAALVLLIAFGLSAAGGRASFQSEQERIASIEIDRALSVIQTGDLSADLSDTRPKAKGEAGEIERVTKESLAEMWTVAKAYNADIAALALDDLEPRALARADLNDVIARLDKARDLTVAYRTAAHAVMDGLPAKFAKADISAFSRAQGLKSLEETLTRSTARLDALLDLQEQAVALNREQVVFLRTHRGGWIVQNGALAFYEASVMREFNTRAGKIAGVLAEIEAGKQGEARRVDGYRETLKRYQ